MNAKQSIENVCNSLLCTYYSLTPTKYNQKHPLTRYWHFSQTACVYEELLSIFMVCQGFLSRFFTPSLITLETFFDLKQMKKRNNNDNKVSKTL